MLRHFARAYTTSAPRAAAAAAAAAATVRKPVARAAPVRRAAAAPKPAASTASKPTTRAPAEPEPPTFDDLDPDLKLPEPEISDYASLRPRPPAAPPLSALPDSSYVPLPSASLGSNDMRDAYVFDNSNSKLPGEIAAADWTTSFRGLSERPFDKDVAEALLRPLEPEDVEIKPDGLLYLPEIKYRRTLNAAFGPGGWGMAPRGETHVGPKIVSREWGLVCLGRLVAIARGEQEYFDPSGIPTATEACKSNALMRCCKDLGIASELWDPRFIREFKAKHCVEMMVEHVVQKKKRKLWRRKDAKFDYPYKEVGPAPK